MIEQKVRTNLAYTLVRMTNPRRQLEDHSKRMSSHQARSDKLSSEMESNILLHMSMHAFRSEQHGGLKL